MTDELIGAIRNALDRGSSLEQAVQSLINAGYGQLEVNEAAKSFTQSATSISHTIVVPKSLPPSKPEVKPSPPSISKPFVPSTPLFSSPKQIHPASSISVIQPPVRNPEEVNKERKQTIAMLLAILILILGIIILVLMFKDQLLKLIS